MREWDHVLYALSLLPILTAKWGYTGPLRNIQPKYCVLKAVSGTQVLLTRYAGNAAIGPSIHN